MVTVSTEKRILCRTLLTPEGIRQMMVIDRGGEALCVEPFSVETAATVFEPRPVVMVKTSEVTDFLMDDLDLLEQKNDFIPQILEYMLAAGLYPGPGSYSSAVTVLVL